jgi:hypothetical protein
MKHEGIDPEYSGIKFPKPKEPKKEEKSEA